MTTQPHRSIDEIKVGDRIRKDLGDIPSLSNSIHERGLLQPIVITSDGTLIAGQRRLEACRSLGWRDVPVRIVTHFDDARSRLLAEQDENTCRKDMTPSEKVALGRALEALERPRATARQGTRKDLGEPSGWQPGSVEGDTRDIVGSAVGWGGRTYDRRGQIVQGPRPIMSISAAIAQVIERDVMKKRQRRMKAVPA